MNNDMSEIGGIVILCQLPSGAHGPSLDTFYNALLDAGIDVKDVDGTCGYAYINGIYAVTVLWDGVGSADSIRLACNRVFVKCIKEASDG